MSRRRIAVIGAGLIGMRHCKVIAAGEVAELAAVADPGEAGLIAARRHGVPHHEDALAMLDAERPDGVIVAAPNQLHRTLGLACIERGLPVLVEKPLADDLAAGAELVERAARAGVPLMVGHHRRFNPMVETAKQVLDRGDIGRIVAVSAQWAVCKPAEYFDVTWRRSDGGGPILINLIHDIDCLRHLVGEIEEVQAITSNAARGFEVEDTAAIAIRFEGGALGTVTLTDTAPSPWSWECGSADNPGIAPSGENCYRFMGSEGALDFPNLTVWRTAEPGAPSWAKAMRATPRSYAPGEALPSQIEHLVRVIDGAEAPRVSGREGLATLAATLAVTEAARSRRPVCPADLLAG